MLKLQRLTLTDIGPTAGKREIRFPASGVIGIVGPNGCGKSHVSHAIKFLLTGKTDAQLWTYINGFGKGANKGEMELEFDLDGQTVILKRTITLQGDADQAEYHINEGSTLKCRVAASLKIGDNPAVRSATEINDTLVDLLGLNSSVEEDSVFVNQNQAGAILSATPAVVQTALQELSGAAVCAEAASVASGHLASTPGPVDRSQEIEDKKEVVESLKEAITNLAGSIAVNKEAISKIKEEEDEARGYLEKARNSLEKQSKLKALPDIEQLKKVLEDNKKHLQVKEEELSNLQLPTREEYSSWGNRASEIKNQEKEFSRKEKIAASKEEVKVSVEGVKSALLALTEKGMEDEELQSLKDGLDRAKQKLASSSSFLKVFGTTGKCPTCGSEPEDKELVNKHNKVVDTLPPEIQKVEVAVAEEERIRKSYSVNRGSLNTKLEGLSADIKRIKEEEKELQEAVAPKEGELQEVRDKITAADSAFEKETKVKEEMEYFREIIRNKSVELLTTEKEKKTLEAEAEVDPKKLEKYKQMIDRLSELQDSTSQMVGTRDTKEEQLKEVKGTLAMLEQEQKIAEKKLKVRGFLEGIKTVMHRTAIPYDIAAMYVGSLNDSLARNSTKLSSPFTLTIHQESLRFLAKFPDKTVPIQKLSGGQYTLAAWIWHLTLYEQHGKNFGFMIFDEPTVGLDEVNMSSVAEAATAVNEYCEGIGVQMLLITHEKELDVCMSEVIKLG